MFIKVWGLIFIVRGTIRANYIICMPSAKWKYGVLGGDEVSLPPSHHWVCSFNLWLMRDPLPTPPPRDWSLHAGTMLFTWVRGRQRSPAQLPGEHAVVWPAQSRDDFFLALPQNAAEQTAGWTPALPTSAPRPPLEGNVAESGPPSSTLLLMQSYCCSG